MEDLHIALVQTDLHWEDKTANFSMLEEKLFGIKGKADIIVLPEMFSTGFSMEPARLAEEMSGDSVNWMLKKSADLNSVLTGSLIIKEDEAYFNRLIWAKPDGTLQYYDKRHLFSMAGEDKAYFQGHEKLITECKGWKICPMICYDLRFPVWIRNTEMYDLLIFTANWPDRRINHWRTLLPARAIENQCYVVGENRVGVDGTGLSYTGYSAAITPMGEKLFELANVEKTEIATLTYEEITKVRRHMPFLRDRDEFELKL